MPIQNVLMDYGTWLNPPDNYYPHADDSYMSVDSYKRPLIHFANDGFSGQILSANLYVYCSAVPDRIGVTGYRVNRAYNNALAAWATPWGVPGCDQISEDRSNTPALTGDIQYTGWTACPIVNLNELLAIINGLDAILLIGADGIATIAKSPAPYLAIEYKTSIVGGIQIF